MFSLLRACFGGNDTKPTPMKVFQGLKIIMLTKMDNLGALLCKGAPVMFKDSRENEMNENFLMKIGDLGVTMSFIFQCGYPRVSPTPGGFAALQSYGGLRG